MIELYYLAALLLASVGFFCLGVALQQRRVLYWRVKWIEMEHDLARLQGREPRDIKSVEGEAQ